MSDLEAVRERLARDAEMIKEPPLGTVDQAHICWATDTLSFYLHKLPGLLNELEDAQTELSRLRLHVPRHVAAPVNIFEQGSI